MMDTYIYDNPGTNERLYMGFQAPIQEQQRRAFEAVRKFEKAFEKEGKEGEKAKEDEKRKKHGEKK
jgi:hypothetical protein